MADLLTEQVLNYLGQPSQLTVPGTLSIAQGGPPALPAASGVGGIAGATGATPGGTGGSAAAAAGPNALQLLAESLGLAGKAGCFLEKLLPKSDAAPPSDSRGDTGGQSLSDQVRSATSAPSDAAAIAGGVPLNQTLTTGGPSSPLSATDVLRENLPPSGDGGGAGGAAGAGGGDLGTVGAGAGLLGAGLGVAGSLTNNPDLAEAGAGAGAAGQTIGAASTVADALAGAEVGLGAGAGVITLPMALLGLANEFGAFGKDSNIFNIGDMFTSGGKPAGWSKFLSQLRSKEAAEASNAAVTATGGEQAFQTAETQGITDPTTLTNLGESLITAGLQPGNLESGFTSNPNLSGPLTGSMADALGINQYLGGTLPITPTVADTTGIDQPTNVSSYPSQGADFTPLWGPAGPPPADLFTSPAGQKWLNQNWVAYEGAGGIQPTPYVPQSQPAPAPGPAVPESIATSVAAAGPEAAVPLDLADQIRQTLAA